MNKWENNNKKCYCIDDSGLFVPNRQLSAFVAGLLFLLFCCFIGGYFLGKRSCVEYFIDKQRKELQQDQYVIDLATDDSLTMNFDTSIEISPVESVENVVINIKEEQPITIAAAELIEPKKHYYAQLCGFGTEKAASSFVKKLALKDIETVVKKRTS